MEKYKDLTVVKEIQKRGINGTSRLMHREGEWKEERNDSNKRHQDNGEWNLMELWRQPQRKYEIKRGLITPSGQYTRKRNGKKKTKA